MYRIEGKHLFSFWKLWKEAESNQLTYIWGLTDSFFHTLSVLWPLKPVAQACQLEWSCEAGHMCLAAWMLTRHPHLLCLHLPPFEACHPHLVAEHW